VEKKSGYSQQELAAILGVANVCISRWENGARELPSFLHFALSCMENKDSEFKQRGIKEERGLKG